MRNRAILLGLLVPSLCGCSAWSNWSYVREAPGGRAVTEVTVVTDPPGAEISLNGDYQAESPVVIPVRYPYDARIFARRKAAPPEVEEKMIRNYRQNEFVFSAYATGYERASTTLAFRGEKAQEVHFNLVKKPLPPGFEPEEEEETPESAGSTRE